MNITIIGSRKFNDPELVEKCIKKELPDINCIISGGARGADTLAEKAAKKFKVPVQIIKPEWNRYGRSAGFKRNKILILKADKIIAFWDGENKAADSGIHHLGHVMACASILLDAESCGQLNDDRPLPGKAAVAISERTVSS